MLRKISLRFVFNTHWSFAALIGRTAWGGKMSAEDRDAGDRQGTERGDQILKWNMSLLSEEFIVCIQTVPHTQTSNVGDTHLQKGKGIEKDRKGEKLNTGQGKNRKMGIESDRESGWSYGRRSWEGVWRNESGRTGLEEDGMKRGKKKEIQRQHRRGRNFKVG